MDLIEITNKFSQWRLLKNLIPKEVTIDLHNNLVVPTSYNLIPIPDSILFNGHLQMFFLLMGLWALDEIFSITLWHYVKPIRKKIKDIIRSGYTKYIKSKLLYITNKCLLAFKIYMEWGIKK